MLGGKVMNKDFKDFKDTSTYSAPREASNTILDFVKRDLNPDKRVVFTKILSIQAFIGLLTMTFCPQFSLSLTANYDLFHYFHHTFGEVICMIICGSIFMGSAAIFSCAILKGVELKQIRQSKGLHFMALSIFSLSAFFIAGAKIYSLMTIFWLIGAIGSGVIVFEFNNFFRQTFKLG
jgi:hypothetical protein